MPIQAALKEGTPQSAADLLSAQWAVDFGQAAKSMRLAACKMDEADEAGPKPDLNAAAAALDAEAIQMWDRVSNYLQVSTKWASLTPSLAYAEFGAAHRSRSRIALLTLRPSRRAKACVRPSTSSSTASSPPPRRPRSRSAARRSAPSA